MKIFESEEVIIYRGFDKNIADEHVNNPNPDKMLMVFDTCENFLKEELNYNSSYLAMHQIFPTTTNEWIIELYKQMQINMNCKFGIYRG